MSHLTVATEIAVAWAAIFVPFLVFLKPSMPQDRNSFGTPVASQMVIMVLFLETRMLQMGMSLKAAPLIREVGVLASGKTFVRELKWVRYLNGFH